MSEIQSTINEEKKLMRKPDWLRVKLPTGKEYAQVREIVSTHKLHTICESGNCPNMGECWGAGTATFMILGNICTRSCGFCNVATGRPLAVDLLIAGLNRQTRRSKLNRIHRISFANQKLH